MNGDGRSPRLDLLHGTVIGVASGVLLVGTALAASPYAALAAVPAILGGLVVLLRPEVGLYATAFVIPIERLGRFTDDAATVPISLMRIVGSAALAVYVLHLIVRRRRLSVGREGIVLGVFTVLVGLSSLYSTDPTNAQRGFSLWLGNLLFFLLIVNGVRSVRMARLVLLVTLTSAVLIGGFSLYQWRFQQANLLTAAEGHGIGAFDTEERFSGVFEDPTEREALGNRPRLAGPTSHPSVYAVNLLCLLPITVYFFHRRRSVLALPVLVGVLAVLGMSLLLTGTRAAMLTAGILGLLMVAARLILVRPVTVAVVFAACVALPWVAPKSITERIFSVENYSLRRAAALRVRLSYWRAGVAALSEHPLLGVGYSNMREVPKRTPDAPREGSTVHNSLLQVAVELGALGAVTWVVLLGWAFGNVLRARRAFRAAGRTADALLATALGLTIVAPLIFGMSVDWHQFPMKVWWLAVGLVAVLRRIAEGELVEQDPEPILPVLERVRSAA